MNREKWIQIHDTQGSIYPYRILKGTDGEGIELCRIGLRNASLAKG
jgi:hypothetical protein